MEKTAVIGFGCAGYHGARALRRLRLDWEIDVYSDHGAAPCNPMLTTYFSGGKLERGGMFPFGELEDIAAELKLNIIKNTRVEKLLLPEKTVVTAAGKKTYDKVLIASGAYAFAPPLPGVDAEGNYFMRTVADADRLRALMDAGTVKSAVVVGASMVGIKVAELLNNHGVHVTIADMAPYLFPLAAFPDVGEAIGGKVRRKGVELVFGKGLAEIRRAEGVSTVVFSDSSAITCDIVVLCIGTRPAIGFLDKDSIAIGRAVKVNGRMETSVPGVYAAGDCCEGNDIQAGDTKIIGLWANAGNQGDTAGANMAGNVAEYPGNILHNITHFMDMDFIGLGDNRSQGETVTFGSADGPVYIEARLSQGRIGCLNILGDHKISGILKNYFIKRLEGCKDGIPAVQKGLLIKEGLSPEFIERLEVGAL